MAQRSPAIYGAGVSVLSEQLRARRRRSLGRRCAHCHRAGALQVVGHPAGSAVQCRYCAVVREVLPHVRVAPEG